MKDKDLQFDRTCHVIYTKACKREIRKKLPHIIRLSKGKRPGSWYRNSMPNFSPIGAATSAAGKISTTAGAAIMTALRSWRIMPLTEQENF